MKQIIDKSDNLPVFPLVVQPKISPDSDNALYEKENGMKVDKPIIVKHQVLTLIDTSTGTIYYSRYGNIVQVVIYSVRTDSLRKDVLAPGTLPLPLSGQLVISAIIAWKSPDSIAAHAIVRANGSLEIISNETGNAKFGTITYICE